MSLEVLWFIIIAVFWTGFFVLEGFDFGVGALHRVVGRTDVERRVVINTIGPVWDGNEVWLIVGGAAIFAAFPSWYATWFSAGYLALVLILVALIIRGVSFEWRGRMEHATAGAARGAGTLTIGSVLAPLLFGVALGDLLAGLPIDDSEEFTGDVLGPAHAVRALASASPCSCCACCTGRRSSPCDRPGRSASAPARWRVGWPGPACCSHWSWRCGRCRCQTPTCGRRRSRPVPVLAAVAAVVLVRGAREGLAFTATAVTIGGTIAALFANLYPNVLVSSTDAANNLTVSNTASAHYALTVMTVVAGILFPLVLVYQGWTYYVFRARVTTPAAPDDVPVSTGEGRP